MVKNNTSLKHGASNDVLNNPNLTLFILMDFPNKHGCVHAFLRDHKSKFLNCNIFLSLKIDFILANSVDPSGMPHYAGGISSEFSLFAKAPVYQHMYPE